MSGEHGDVNRRCSVDGGRAVCIGGVGVSELHQGRMPGCVLCVGEGETSVVSRWVIILKVDSVIMWCASLAVAWRAAPASRG